MTLEDLIKSGSFGVARTLGGSAVNLAPSWVEEVKGDDGETTLDDLFAEDDSPDLHRLFELEQGKGLGLVARAGETGADGVTPFVASTAAVDRMGDIVEQSWRLANFRSNPVIPYEHGSHVVGKGTAKINREAGRLEVRVTWDDSEINPVGQLMAHQHRNGFRRAGSVGFRPGKAVSRADLPDDDPRKSPKGTPRWRAGHVFRFNELLEFSTVAVPANPEAVQLGLHAREAEDPSEQIRRFLDESLDSRLAEKLREIAKSDPEFRDLLRSLVWSAPEPTPKPTDSPTTLDALFAPNH